MGKRDPKSTVEVDVEAKPTDGGARRGVLTVLGGITTGSVIDISGEPVVVGRTDEADVTIDDHSLSRRHARFTAVRGHYYVSDLDSTNGTFVTGERIEKTVELTDGVRVQLGEATLLRFSLQDEAEYAASSRLYEATVKDALTGVYNRHYLEERLEAEFAFAQRHERPLSVLYVDADHFKNVNDTYGHAAGDEVLRALAKLLIDTVRTEDVVARIGGEEFVVLVRDIEARNMLSIGERLRSAVEELHIEHEGTTIPITVSVGVATMSREAVYASAEGLLAQADAALYTAKEEGRNRVQLV